MSDRFENTRFDSTIDQIVATLALSRARSQQQRRPVQLMWDPARRVVYAAWLDQESLSSEDESNSVQRSSDQAGADQPPSTKGHSGDTLSAADQLNAAGQATKAIWTGGSRLRVTLPEGCCVQAGAPQEPPASPPQDGSILPPPRGGDAAASDQAISLIVYMPDGSTFGQASFVVMDSAGRKSRIDVNSWTGQVVVSRIEASDDAPLDASSSGASSAAPDAPTQGSRQ